MGEKQNSIRIGLTTMTQISEDRIDRIESKIDKLSDLLIQMARIEERMQSQDEDNKEIHKELLSLRTKTLELEKNVYANQITVNAINKLVWVAATSVVGAVVAMVLSYMK